MSDPTFPDRFLGVPGGMPTRITVTCDGDVCPVKFTGDFMVLETDDKQTRLEVARAHLHTNEGWRCVADGDFCPACRHRPTLVYFDAEKLTIPAEVCGTCSDPDTGVWVPVTQCPTSAAQMTDDHVDDCVGWVVDRDAEKEVGR